MCPPSPEKHKQKTDLLLGKMIDFRHCSYGESCLYKVQLAHCAVVQARDRMHV